jgi:hypothetical protein
MFSFEQSKLDLDLGYVANDRSEFRRQCGGFTNEIEHSITTQNTTCMGKNRNHCRRSGCIKPMQILEKNI